MKKEEISTEEITTPKKEVVKVEGKTSSKANPLTIALIVLLMLMLLPVLGILLFRYNTSSQSPAPKGECQCEQCQKTECPVGKDKECNCSSSQVKVTNPGWGVFSAPDIKVSMEVPNFAKSVVTTESDTLSDWKAGFFSTIYQDVPPSEFPDFVKGAYAVFFPQNTQDLGGCGGGCWGEHTIRINAYKNTGNKTLEQVKEIFAAKERTVMGGEPAASAQMKQENKWGENTYSYVFDLTEGQSKGYLVVKNGFIYDVNHFLSTKDAESLNIANKVLDSIRFN